MLQKRVHSRILSLFLCGILLSAPAKVLFAVPIPFASKDDASSNAALQAKRDKEALAALATFKGDDLVKRVTEAPAAATKKEIELGEKASKQIDKDTTIKILDPKKPLRKTYMIN